MFIFSVVFLFSISFQRSTLIFVIYFFFGLIWFVLCFKFLDLPPPQSEGKRPIAFPRAAQLVAITHTIKSQRGGQPCPAAAPVWSPCRSWQSNQFQLGSGTARRAAGWGGGELGFLALSWRWASQHSVASAAGRGGGMSGEFLAFEPYSGSSSRPHGEMGTVQH